jgi:hypothetical protein
MSHNTAPPFPRGQTLFNKPYSDTSLTTSMGKTVEGQIWTFEDVHPTTGARRSNRRVTCMAVRWTGSSPALPSRLVVLDGKLTTNGGAANTAGPLGVARAAQFARAGNTADVLPAKCYPVDEYLPTAGVAANDIMWVVIDGPAMVKTPNTNFTDIAVGDALVALTGATATASTDGNSATGAGLVATVDLSLTAVTGPRGIENRVVGVALSAATTGYGDLLADIGGWKF